MSSKKKPSLFSRMFARRQSVTAGVVPPRHSPQLPPVPDDQWYAYYCELSEDINDRFVSVPGHKTSHIFRDPLLNALNEAAAKSKDSDAMRLYDEFPLTDNRNLIELIPAMRKVLKIDSLQGILTQEHIDAHRRLNDLFTDSNISGDEKAWVKLQAFLLLDLSRADAIIRIVEDREIYDPKVIATLLNLGDGTAPALADGLL